LDGAPQRTSVPNNLFAGSARPPEMIQSSSVGPCAVKNLFSFVFFIGSARPPEMIQSSSFGPCAMKNLFSIVFFIGSARPQFDKVGAI